MKRFRIKWTKHRIRAVAGWIAVALMTGGIWAYSWKAALIFVGAAIMLDLAFGDTNRKGIHRS